MFIVVIYLNYSFIFDSNGSWKIDLIITRFYLEYILNFILFELIIYLLLLLLELFSYVRFEYRVVREKLIPLLHAFISNILNFILFELIISLYCCYLFELFSYVWFLIRIYRVAREKLISLFHALLEINLEYILNFILFRSTISR